MRKPTVLLTIALIAALSAPLAAQQPAPAPLLNQIVQLAEYINVYPLTANDDQVVTIPVGYQLAIFGMEGEGTFWIKRATSCSVPTTTITNGAGAEPNPAARIIRRKTGSTSFCIVTADAGLTVTISWYKLD
jgi:hypothetical protein